MLPRNHRKFWDVDTQLNRWIWIIVVGTSVVIYCRVVVRD